MTQLFSLEGKIAIVTGAASGMGKAIACAMADAGASIVGIDYASCDDTKDKISKNGGKFWYIQADLMTGKAIPDIINQVLYKHGRVDILVNCAGIIRREYALNICEKDWDDVLSINLKTVFLFCQAVARIFKKQGGGKIINIASMLSFQGGIRVVSYAASKSGIAGITRSLANEWASDGINVNALAPGYIDTNLTTALVNDEERSASILARIPAGRWGQPTDVAGAAVFLASPAADYIHGVILPVDGGWLAR